MFPQSECFLELSPHPVALWAVSNLTRSCNADEAFARKCGNAAKLSDGSAAVSKNLFKSFLGGTASDRAALIRKALAASCSAALKHIAPVFAFHSHAKSMRSLLVPVVGLVRSFH